MATKRKREGGRKNRKYGRNIEKCEKYRREKRREKNKIRKFKKIFKKQPNNYQLVKRIKELENYVNS